MNNELNAKTNVFKQRLQAGETLIGIWTSLANRYTAEICGQAGFDWMLLDGEHAPNDIRTIMDQLQVLEAHPSSAAVARPPHDATWLIKQYLDVGAQTLLVPMIDTAEHARALVAATRYPPEGVRGVGAGYARASYFGKRPNYIPTANNEICILAQAETVTAISNLKEIASTPGIDGVFIGPSDLAASMGHLGNPGHPEVVAAIESAFQVIKSCGKAPGILTADINLARHYLEKGAQFIAVASDVHILAAGLKQVRSSFQ